MVIELDDLAKQLEKFARCSFCGVNCNRICSALNNSSRNGMFQEPEGELSLEELARESVSRTSELEIHVSELLLQMST
mgnify:CR=1 FL=1